MIFPLASPARSALVTDCLKVPVAVRLPTARFEDVAFEVVEFVAVKLVKAAVKAEKRLETEKFVEVALVIVALDAIRFVRVEVKAWRTEEKKFVEVELVFVELVELKFVVFKFPEVVRFETVVDPRVEEALVEILPDEVIVAFPLAEIVPPAVIFPVEVIVAFPPMETLPLVVMLPAEVIVALPNEAVPVAFRLLVFKVLAMLTV